jgi:putative transposase
MLRDALKEAVQDYGIRLFAWVILADHYHLLLQTGETAPLWKFVKRLHGASAIRLNKSDHRPGRKVWYQYWDRCPRNEREFWTYFNYIHFNPIKHGYVYLSREGIVVEGEYVQVTPDEVPDVHECLRQYPHSSYGYYLRTYGEEFLTDAWMRYPVLEHLEHDDF